MAAKSKRYRVVNPAGMISSAGTVFAKGDTFEDGQHTAAHISAWLRFRQIEEIEAKMQTPAKKKQEAPAGQEPSDSASGASEGEQEGGA